MRNMDYFKNKKITILGLARSGLSCANLLKRLGAEVSVSDNQDNVSTLANAAKLNPGINYELGKHTRDFIEGRDLIVISPGVPYNALPLLWAKENGIKAVSEIEVGWILCPTTVIAVTGSNGKTTVTTLIGKVLQAQGKKVFVCGNIGNPFCAEVEKMREGDFACLEVSSFQLQTTDKFKPKVAVILNFSRNHLDRHSDMQDYFLAKKRIFMNQDAFDYLVLNERDAVLKNLAKEARSRAVYFSEGEVLNPNQAAVLAVGSIFGIPDDLCFEVFSNFKGVEHRMEAVSEIAGVEFINDSKSTTVEATMWALKVLKRPVILIAGGRDKNLDYSVILDLALRKVRDIILIGEAKDKIRKALEKFPSIHDAENLEEAVILGLSMAKPGDCVLLSPMCASFDMFLDYEDRGRVFKKIVHNLNSNDKIKNLK